MPDPFAAALDALFSAPGSAAAIYVPDATGSSIPVRVIERQLIDADGSIAPSTRVVGGVFDLRIAEIADPEPGDVLIANGRQYVVVTRPDHDVERLTWHIETPVVDRTICILRYGRGPNEFGDVTANYARAVTVPVSFWPIRGIETGVGVEVASRSAMRFLIAWTAQVDGLNPKDRVEYDGRVYDIDAVVEVGDRVGLEIRASARDDQ